MEKLNQIETAETVVKGNETADKMPLKGRIDFVALVRVDGANPNGDPGNGGRPRINSEGLGEITDVCIKSKIRKAARNVFGENILCQPSSDNDDGCVSIKERLEKRGPKADKNISKEEYRTGINQYWFDTRAFGALIPFRGSDSLNETGTVSFNAIKSVSKVDLKEYGITRGSNVNTKESKNGESQMGSERMGTQFRIGFGLYVIKGSISPYRADKNGFTQKDAETLKGAILMMFEDDASAARPAGSMSVERLYWWEHESRYVGVGVNRVHEAVKITKKGDPDAYPTSMDDYEIVLENPEGVVMPEVISM